MFTSRARSARSRTAGPRRPRARLWLVGLEDRIAPANLIVTDAGDNGGPGQLRAVLAIANSNGQPDTITFDSSVTTVSLASALPTYTENQNLTIAGNGKTVTVIDGAQIDRIFDLNVPSAQPTITIRDLTLQGGFSAGNGGAILDANETLLLKGVIFAQNTALAGGAIAVSAATTTLTISGCEFTGNSATNASTSVLLGGGGLFIGGASTVTIVQSTFDGNFAGSGGSAIAVARNIRLNLSCDSTDFKNGISQGSSQTYSGGAILLGGTVGLLQSILVDHASVIGNSSEYNGGFINCTFDANICIKNSSITNNSAKAYGGAINPWAGPLSLINTTFSNNSAGQSGGAISTLGPLTILNCDFSHNHAGFSAGAIYSQETGISFSTFTGNSCGGDGGAIFTSAPLSIDHSVLSGNTSSAWGGAIYSYENLNANYCIFTKNQSLTSNGGAIYGGGTVTFCDFDANTAGANGGAMSFLSPSSVSNCTVRENIAGALGGGFAFNEDMWDTTINQCTFTKNSAFSNGGALLGPSSGTSLTINNTTIYDNSTAGKGGGIARTSNGMLVINSSIIAGNHLTGASTVGIDLYSSTTVTLAGNNNLVGTNSNSSVTFAGTVLAGTNAAPINPLLGPLGDNGGPALPDGNKLKTFSLLAGSPAIDAGNNKARFTFDQRDVGFDRVNGPTADIGAVEVPGKYPKAVLIAGANITTEGNAPYSFAIKYYDGNGGDIDTTTFGLADVTVTGNGFGAGQNPTSFSVAGTGTAYTVTYTIPAPTGGWGGRRIGSYLVSINAAQVLDLNDGLYVPALPIGVVHTAIPTVLQVDEASDVDDGQYGNGQFSLREALSLANANVGKDTIMFDLTKFNGTPIVVGSTLKINDDLTISGPGKSRLVLSGADTRQIINIAISGGAKQVEISGLTLSHGFDDTGSAIGFTTETVSINNVNLTANSKGTYSAAIKMTAGSLNASNSVWESNVFGIWSTGKGSINIVNSVFQKHSQSAIYGGTVQLTVSKSLFSNNSNSRQGAAINTYDQSVITISQCTFSGNTAIDGGAIHSYADQTLDLRDCTFSKNVATQGAGAVQAGGPYSAGTNQVVIANSTISGNTGRSVGGIICDAYGYAATLSIINCTISGNSATLNTGGIGLNYYSPMNVVLQGTILAGNFGSKASDLGTPTGLVIAGSNNIIGAQETSWTLNGSNNQIGTQALPIDPQLNKLAYNGGVTFLDGSKMETQSLKTNSPAIDAGSNLYLLANDQRGPGFARAYGSQTDIGAFELLPSPPTVTSVVFGDGTNQRSLVKQIVVTFSEPVNFMGGVAGSFTLHRSGSGGTIGDVALSATPASGPASVVTITFSGSLTDPGGSLKDGLYNLIIGAAQVSGAGGPIDGNGDGVPGGDYVVNGTTANKFYRLFGDSNGDATVDQIDLLTFRDAIAAGPGSFFDFDSSGDVDQIDYLELRERIAGSP